MFAIQQVVRLTITIIFFQLVLPSLATTCTTNLDCSLNGLCQPHTGSCLCDKPWHGSRCGVLKYQSNQPMSSANLYPHNDTGAPKTGPCVTASGSCTALNTWNGPIVKVGTQYHMFNPLYKRGNLFETQDMMHGIATNITGPYSWRSQGQGDLGSNPAFVTFQDPDTNATTFSLWSGQASGLQIYVSDDINGIFVPVNGSMGGFSNVAPLYYNGKWYATDQGTRKIRTTPKLGDPWTLYSEIHATFKGAYQEDPFMWVDKRNNWHIINHAYNTTEIENCGQSTLSAHLFSLDGKAWHILTEPQVEPYSHTVSYEDGTTHTYTTLERPNCQFNEKGEMTSINLAADLMTQDAGCKDYSVCPAKTKAGNCACTNCKYADHAGSIIIALDV